MKPKVIYSFSEISHLNSSRFKHVLYHYEIRYGLMVSDIIYQRHACPNCSELLFIRINNIKPNIEESCPVCQTVVDYNSINTDITIRDLLATEFDQPIFNDGEVQPVNPDRLRGRSEIVGSRFAHNIPQEAFRAVDVSPDIQPQLLNESLIAHSPETDNIDVSEEVVASFGRRIRRRGYTDTSGQICYRSYYIQADGDNEAVIYIMRNVIIYMNENNVTLRQALDYYAIHNTCELISCSWTPERIACGALLEPPVPLNVREIILNPQIMGLDLPARIREIRSIMIGRALNSVRDRERPSNVAWSRFNSIGANNGGA